MIIQDLTPRLPVFGKYALVQRCQWHKRENVVSYLPKSRQQEVRKDLQRAYEETTYDEAKARLKKIRHELSLINESAARSLDEGLEETLTLHRLGLFKELGKSLKTTNCLESIMARDKARRQTKWITGKTVIKSRDGWLRHFWT